MEPQDLVTQLDYLNLTTSELAILIEVPDTDVACWLLGTRPIPAWLDLITLYWCEFDGTLQLARRRAVARKLGGPTADDIIAGDDAAIVRVRPH